MRSLAWNRKCIHEFNPFAGKGDGAGVTQELMRRSRLRCKVILSSRWYGYSRARLASVARRRVERVKCADDVAQLADDGNGKQGERDD